MPKGSYYAQLLGSVARVAEHPSPTVKAALLAPPKSTESLYTAVADIRDACKEQRAADAVYMANAKQAEQLWRRIAAGLDVDLSKPFVPPMKTVRCGNLACPAPEKTAASACAGCVKSSSPQRYCGASTERRPMLISSGAVCQRGASIAAQ